MGLSSSSIKRLNDFQAKQGASELALLDGVALPEIAKRNFVEPMSEKARELLQNFHPGQTSRVLAPEASRILRSYPEAAILFVNPRSLDDSSAGEVLSISGQRQIASKVTNLISQGLIKENTKMEDMVKFMSPSIIATYIPEVAGQVYGRLRESSERRQQFVEQLQADEKRAWGDSVVLPPTSRSEKSPSTGSYSLVYKHPVTNFDFFPVGGGYHGIKVSGMAYGESRTDETGKICITNLGVGNDGHRFRIEFTDNTQYSMRSRLGDRGYAFQQIGMRQPQLTPSLTSETPAIIAANLYKKYSNIYASGGASEEQSHQNAIAGLGGAAVNDDVKAVIKSWADRSKSPVNKKFFERFLNSV